MNAGTLNTGTTGETGCGRALADVRVAPAVVGTHNRSTMWEEAPLFGSAVDGPPLQEGAPTIDAGSRAPSPILKWAGGKRSLAPLLRGIFERETGGPGLGGRPWVEPFLGGASMFLETGPARALLSDVNEELILTYRTVASSSALVVERIHRLAEGHCEEEYYRVRAMDWRELDPVDAAARMVYLNRTGFNGLYRVNRKGGFNVPYGGDWRGDSLTTPRLADAIRAFGERIGAEGVELRASDWREALEEAPDGSAVFLDPPYLPVSKTANFTKYAAGGFGVDEHRDMAEHVERMRSRGCVVVLTNSVHPLIRELYEGREGYSVEEAAVSRTVAPKRGSRRSADLVVVARP